MRFFVCCAKLSLRSQDLREQNLLAVIDRLFTGDKKVAGRCPKRVGPFVVVMKVEQTNENTYENKDYLSERNVNVGQRGLAERR